MLKLANNTTILLGKSQLVCPYDRDLFVSSIFINITLVSGILIAFTSYILF